MTDFSKWDELYDAQDLAKQVEEAAKNEFKSIPEGEYVCKLEKMELGEAKTGTPMLKVQLKIIEGEFKNQSLFYNQSLTSGWGVHKANEFIRTLEVFDDNEVAFNGWKDYNDLILDAVEAAQEDKKEYKVVNSKREYNGKKYDSPEIVQAYN